MAWLKQPDAEGDPDVKRYFDAVLELFDTDEVPEVRSIFGYRPDLVAAFEEFARKVLTAGTLTQFERELIATMSAATGQCSFCTVAHGEEMCALPDNYVDVTALLEDHETAGLTPRHRAMVDFAIKLTASPSAMTMSDVDRLREVGLGDSEIFDVILAVAYRNFMNRIADGTGAALPDDLLRVRDQNPERVEGYSVGRDLF